MPTQTEQLAVVKFRCQTTPLSRSTANMEVSLSMARFLKAPPSCAAVPTPGRNPGVSLPAKVDTDKAMGVHAVDPGTDHIADPHGTGA